MNICAARRYVASLTLRVVEIFRYAQIKSAATYNFTPLVGVALVFIVVTIPLIHLVDWLVARDRRQAPVGAAR